MFSNFTQEQSQPPSVLVGKGTNWGWLSDPPELQRMLQRSKETSQNSQIQIYCLSPLPQKQYMYLFYNTIPTNPVKASARKGLFRSTKEKLLVGKNQLHISIINTQYLIHSMLQFVKKYPPRTINSIQRRCWALLFKLPSRPSGLVHS